MKECEVMQVIGLFLMLFFGLSTLLISFSVEHSADILLIIASGSMMIFGLLLWRRKNLGILTKLSMGLMTVLALGLFGVTMPDSDEPTSPDATRNHEKSEVSDKDDIEESQQGVEEQVPSQEGAIFIGDLNSGVYHRLDCEGISHIKKKNQVAIFSQEEIQTYGLVAAGDCHP